MAFILHPETSFTCEQRFSIIVPANTETLRRYRMLFLTALSVFIADQLSKWYILENIPRFRSVDVIPNFLHIVNIRNRGAAFGILNNPNIDWQIWLFGGVTILAVLFIVHLMKTATRAHLWLAAGLGSVLGGAFGNMLDRIRFGAVIDFIDIQLGTYHWPAFNIADTGICIGTGIACIILWNTPSKKTF